MARGYKRPSASGNETTKLSDVNTNTAPSSKAKKTEFVSFSTTPDLKREITRRAHEMEISRSELIEAALLAYLGE